MSTVIVKVCEIQEIRKHPQADKLDIILIDGWQVIEKSGLYRPKDICIFCPPDVVLPPDLITKYNVANYLASGNRVKAIKLRGEKSFGLLLKPDFPVNIGDNLATILNIKKYEPPAPSQSLPGSGSKTQQAKRHPLWQRYTEIENIRHYSKILEGSQVVVTEKIHGCNCSVAMLDGELVVSSHNYNRQPPYKYTERRLNFLQKLLKKVNRHWFGPLCSVDEDAKCLDWYWHPTTLSGVIELLEELAQDHKQVILYGETFGKVQRGMGYGTPDALQFRAFDLLLDGHYVDHAVFKVYCQMYNIPTAPEIWRGPYSLEMILKLADGFSVVEGAPPNQIREGVVVKSLIEKRDPKCGRMIFKAIGSDYLLKQYTKEAVEDATYE